MGLLLCVGLCLVLTRINSVSGSLDGIVFKKLDGPGAVYVGLDQPCSFQKEHDAHLLLRMRPRVPSAELNKMVDKYITSVKERGGELCDINKGLRCAHRLFTPKEEIDVASLIRRKNAQVDPDDNGVLISGLEKISKTIADNVTLNVVSTCRCNPLDSQLFARECLVRAGFPCRFKTLFPARKCTQNAECVGGIEDLEYDFEGFAAVPPYTRLLKSTAITTCRCLFGFTRTSGRECLKGEGSLIRIHSFSLAVIAFNLVVLLPLNCQFLIISKR